MVIIEMAVMPSLKAAPKEILAIVKVFQRYQFIELSDGRLYADGNGINTESFLVAVTEAHRRAWKIKQRDSA
jgi:hypothetical protein